MGDSPVTKTIITCLVLISVLLTPVAANADIIMIITDNGADLTMTATGTYDNTGLEVLDTISLGANAVVAPTICCYGWETSGGNIYSTGMGYSGALTGTNDAFPADLVSTTNPFFFWSNNNAIVFGIDTPLSGSVNESATFFGVTLASLGMVAGESITASWGNNNAIIRTVAATPIAEPGTLALVGVGLLGMGLARRRKKV